MSDCSLSLGGGDSDGSDEFHNVETLKARKEHRCEECRQIIPRGARYHRIAGKFDGDFFMIKTCLPCAEIRDAFVDGAFNYGELWAEMRDHGFVNMNTGCLQKLESAEAKQFLLDRWNEWKFKRTA